MTRLLLETPASGKRKPATAAGCLCGVHGVEGSSGVCQGLGSLEMLEHDGGSLFRVDEHLEPAD